jgi:hypothetical protein
MTRKLSSDHCTGTPLKRRIKEDEIYATQGRCTLKELSMVVPLNFRSSLTITNMEVNILVEYFCATFKNANSLTNEQKNIILFIFYYKIDGASFPFLFFNGCRDFYRSKYNTELAQLIYLLAWWFEYHVFCDCFMEHQGGTNFGKKKKKWADLYHFRRL